MGLKLIGLALVIMLPLALLGSVGPVVQASDNTSDNATVNLEVEVVSPPREGGGISGISLYPIKTNLFSEEQLFYTNYKGEVLKAIEATSEDDLLTMTISKGTIALGEDGKRLKTLDVVVNESPPDSSEDNCIIGLAYNFSPNGATFDPPITFTWRYDPDTLPSEGVANLFVAYYDEETSEWVELPCTVDATICTITALVSHLTTFAIIGTVSPMPPLPSPILDEEEVVPPPEEEEIAPPTEPEEVELPEEEVVTEEEEEVAVAFPPNWWFISIVLTVVIVVIVALFYYYNGF